MLLELPIHPCNFTHRIQLVFAEQITENYPLSLVTVTGFEFIFNSYMILFTIFFFVVFFLRKKTCNFFSCSSSNTRNLAGAAVLFHIDSQFVCFVPFVFFFFLFLFRDFLSFTFSFHDSIETTTK